MYMPITPGRWVQSLFTRLPGRSLSLLSPYLDPERPKPSRVPVWTLLHLLIRLPAPPSPRSSTCPAHVLAVRFLVFFFLSLALCSSRPAAHRFCALARLARASTFARTLPEHLSPYHARLFRASQPASPLRLRPRRNSLAPSRHHCRSRAPFGPSPCRPLRALYLPRLRPGCRCLPRH